ncbi:farnesyl cysteine carboxyl-methyltransferase [Chitinispirillum alkaliphilum]|nr:farnesyl cysteine carboxyl-methyltransferase [Chitinispirillum alkaliphilum]
MMIERQDTLFYFVYIAALVMGTIIRTLARGRSGKDKVSGPVTDRILLYITYLGMGLFPLIYIFTDLFLYFDYNLPWFSGVIGTGLIFFSLIVLWKAHKDLGKNWSKTHSVQPDQELIQAGIYSYLRHPIYASYWLWALSQPLLLHNVIAGFSMVAAFSLLYFYRVPREEDLMEKAFGNKYKNYMAKTPRLFPRRLFSEIR